MTQQEAYALLPAYVAGDLDEGQHEAFVKWLARDEALRVEATQLSKLWLALTPELPEEPDAAMDETFYARLRHQMNQQPRARQPVGTFSSRFRLTRARSAMVFSLMVISFLGGALVQQWWTGIPTQPVRVSANHSALAANWQSALAYSPVGGTLASERIQAIDQLYALPQLDQAFIQLLVNTLNFDENVMVRLAACRALVRFSHEPRVREALMQSLSVQTDPNVQVSLIDALVTIQEHRAVAPIRRLVNQQLVLDIVRRKAEAGIDQLTQPTNSAS